MKRFIEKTTIYYFSGTGNTNVLAKALEKQFINEGVDTERKFIDGQLIQNIKSNGDAMLGVDVDSIGLCFPVHAFEAPRIVQEFVDALPISLGKQVFILAVPGDPGKINLNCGRYVKKVLRKKGYKVIYERRMAMPGNVVVRFHRKLEKQILKANLIKVKDMVHDLLNGVNREMKAPIYLKAITPFIHFFENHYGGRFFGKSLTVNDQCTQCGICLRNCPMDNICFEEGKIKIGSDCTFCMRCIYNCPENAIVSKGMQFIAIKEGYNGELILNKDEKLSSVSLEILDEFKDDKKYAKAFKRFEKYLVNPKA